MRRYIKTQDKTRVKAHTPVLVAIATVIILICVSGIMRSIEYHDRLTTKIFHGIDQSGPLASRQYNYKERSGYKFSKVDNHLQEKFFYRWCLSIFQT